MFVKAFGKNLMEKDSFMVEKSTFYGIFDTASTDLCLILLIFVATYVNTFFTPSKIFETKMFKTKGGRVQRHPVGWAELKLQDARHPLLELERYSILRIFSVYFSCVPGMHKLNKLLDLIFIFVRKL